MSRAVKRPVLFVGAALGLLAVVALAVVAFVDVDRHRPQVEAVASDALGMKVQFGGRMRLGVLPGLHVVLADARVLDEQDSVVASAKRVRLGIELLPLLRRQVRLSRLDILQLRLSIARSAEGRLHVERLEWAARLVGMLDGARVTLADGTILYTDARDGERIEATGLDVDVRGLRFGRQKGPGLPGLSLSGQLACREIRTKDTALSSLKAAVHAKDGVLRMEPVTMGIFGGKATASLRADLAGPVPRYQLRYALPGFRIEEFLATVSPQRAAEGTMDFTATLSMRGVSRAQLVQTAAGQVSLRSGHLTLLGNDLDRALSRFESSQRFNLVDMGAVFIAGPLGIAVTRGYGFAGLFRGSGGNTDVRMLVSDWAVEGGVARAKDVALATTRNRIALAGGLDFARGRFDDMAVAAVDDKGCVRVRQVIRGSFANPEVEKPSVLSSLAGPVRKVYRLTRRLFPKGPCEAFYSGSVPPPD